MSKNKEMYKRILRCIETYWAEHGYGPSIRDIADVVGLKSTSTVHGYIQRMVKAGHIVQTPGIPHSIQIASSHQKQAPLLLGKTKGKDLQSVLSTINIPETKDILVYLVVS